MSCYLQFGFSVLGSKQSIVSDFHEAFGQQVSDEALDRLMAGEADESMLPEGGVGSSSEGDVAAQEVHQAVVGDGPRWVYRLKVQKNRSIKTDFILSRRRKTTRRKRKSGTHMP